VGAEGDGDEDWDCDGSFVVVGWCFASCIASVVDAGQAETGDVGSRGEEVCARWIRGDDGDRRVWRKNLDVLACWRLSGFGLWRRNPSRKSISNIILKKILLL
jgi:hypothetical protein